MATQPIVNAVPGDKIVITGVVMDRPGKSNVRVLIDGVGAGGTWSIPNTALVEIEGHVLDDDA